MISLVCEILKNSEPWKKVEWSLPGSGGGGLWEEEDVGLRAQASRYKMNTF